MSTRRGQLHPRFHHLRGWGHPKTVAKEVEAYRSGWLGQMPARASTAVFLQTFLFLIDTAWRTTGLMLIGIIKGVKPELLLDEEDE